MDNPPLLPRYTYTPLQRPNSLRLVRLHPGNGSSEIKCELFEVQPNPKKLHDNSLSPWILDKPYEAVSWTWGSENKKISIRIHRPEEDEDYLFEVKENLAAALKALRYEGTVRILWIDTISINQTNADEKNHQVPMMAEVYGSASRVCVWLGKGMDIAGGPKIAVDFIKKEVLDIWGFDKLCENENTSVKWEALIGLMRVPWFSRRWVVQEIALAKEGLLYCGDQTITWKQFSDAVSLFVEVETATHRLSEVMKKDQRLNHIPDFFGHVPALGATTLVEAVNNLFRRSNDSLGKPLLSLEYLVSTMSVFQAGIPHDTIYALLSIAKDAFPRAASQRVKDFAVSGGRQLSGWGSNIASRTYYVDYRQPYTEICREFVEFSIKQAEPHRALDILCRPWAPPIQKEADEISNLKGRPGVREREWRSKLEELPSWIPSLEKAAFTMWGAKMSRANADPLVGQPMSGQRNYSAAGTRPVNLKKLMFKSRARHCSIYLEGFVLDRVSKIEEIARDGNIPQSWLDLGGWTKRDEDPPEEFWRTVVADRGPHGRNAPAFYPTACKEAVRKGLHGGIVQSKTLIHEERCSIVAEFMRRVQAVIWNRCLMRTDSGRLGLADMRVKPGYLICILYGCTVPLVLERYTKTPEDLATEKIEDEEALREEKAIIIQRGYRIIRQRRKMRKELRSEQNERDQKQVDEDQRRRRSLRNRISNWKNPPVVIHAIKSQLEYYFKSFYSTARVDINRLTSNFRKKLIAAFEIYKRYTAILVPAFAIMFLFAKFVVAYDLTRFATAISTSAYIIGPIIVLGYFLNQIYTRWMFTNNRSNGFSNNQYFYKVIGECYVHGMMEHEAIQYQNEQDIKPEVFELR
jgi:hypothetical protein